MGNNLNSIIQIPKFSGRTLNISNKIIQERIESLRLMNYRVFSKKQLNFIDKMPIFTIILTVHDSNLDYLKISLNSIKNQTYQNVELIIIDNGSTGIIKDYIWSFYLNEKRVKLIRVEFNQYNPFLGDLNPLVNLWNAGLFVSVGDYFYFQSYDDLISNNYVESMVRLFKFNRKCVSAAPKTVCIDSNGQINLSKTNSLKDLNKRDEYENGIELAKTIMNDKTKFASTGGLLAQVSQLVLEGGGIDSLNDHTQIFRFAIRGEVGTDASATLFWRHHSLQTNRYQTSLGIAYNKEWWELLRRYELFELHCSVAGLSFATQYRKYFQKELIKGDVYAIYTATSRFGLKIGAKTLFHTLQNAKRQESIFVLFNLLFHALIFLKKRLISLKFN